MPTYAYKCAACGYTFDKFQRFSEDPITTCPNCAREELRRVPSPAPVVFKGTGWYVTDSRSKSPTTAKPKSEKSETSASTTSSTSTGSDSRSTTSTASASID